MFWLGSSKISNKFSGKHGINNYSLLTIVLCHYRGNWTVTGCRFQITNSRILQCSSVNGAGRRKGNNVCVYVMNVCRSRGVAPLILNLGTSGCFALVDTTLLPYMPLYILVTPLGTCVHLCGLVHKWVRLYIME
jgi:hypothetical protein